jgi:hypothetical protein
MHTARAAPRIQSSVRRAPGDGPDTPGFPPALRGVAVVVRKRGFLYGASDDGGLEEVVEFC